MPNATKALFALFALALAIGASGCLRYRAYQVESNGPELVLRRIDLEAAGATDRELDPRPVDRALQRTVQSLQGARVRVQDRSGVVVTGDVIQAEDRTLSIRCSRSESAVEETRSSMYAVDLSTVQELDVADARGEAAITAGVVVGVVGALLALVAAGISASAGN